MADLIKIQQKRNVFVLPVEIPVDYRLGDIENVEDMATRRKSGNMSWGGASKLKSLIDHETKPCMYASRLISAGDPASLSNGKSCAIKTGCVRNWIDGAQICIDDASDPNVLENGLVSREVLGRK